MTGRRTELISKNTDKTKLKEDYVIRVTGTQHYFPHGTEGEFDDKVEVDTLGAYCVRPSGKKIISYRGMDDNGKEGPLTIVKVEDNKLTMTKTSDRTELLVEPGKLNVCAYDTPYGALTLGVQAHGLNQTLDENGGSLQCTYSIYINNMISSRNTLEIHVEKANLK